jgi:hypothetical protein
MRASAALSGLLIVLSVVAGDLDAVVPEADLVKTLPAYEQKAAAEFMQDGSFWSQVSKATDGTPDEDTMQLIEEETPQQRASVDTAADKKTPIIVVKQKDMTMVATVAQTAEEQQAHAEAMCLKAKRQVRSKSASASKAKRRSAIRAMIAFCKKVRGVVTKEVAKDVETIAGKDAGSMVEADAKHGVSVRKEKVVLAFLDIIDV